MSSATTGRAAPPPAARPREASAEHDRRFDDPLEADRPIDRFTVEQYLAMSRAGVLGEDERTELIDGVVYPAMTKDPSHAWHVRRLNGLLARHDTVGPGGPVLLGVRDAPEPDIVVLADRGDHCRTEHPTAADVRLAIGISDRSLHEDLHRKLRRYAVAGIAEYWVVDVHGLVVHRCLRPRPSGYGSVEVLEGDASLATEAALGMKLTDAEAFGRS